ncbi:MAG: glycosyltransferase [Flavobacteriaceae bacterium]|nr:glycosyltransferase [Flavobacteriaceae bacterium]
MILRFKNWVAVFLRFAFQKTPKDFKNLTIYINNFNRLTFLKELIHSLEKRGYRNLVILDNNSTYAPLLKFYESTPYKVIRFNKNYGYKSYWKSGLWLKNINKYFAYTDSDLKISEACPDNFLEYFYELLIKYPEVHKVGFSLKIDDIPNCYKLKNKVINWESRYYEKELEKDLYLAPIDTTFALYRPFSKIGQKDGSTPIVRVGGFYNAHHLPWYVDSKNLDEEELYYITSLTKKTHWSGL